MTARWKAVSPQWRLWRRGHLLKVADFLDTAAKDLNFHPDLAPDLVRDRDLTLDRALGLARRAGGIRARASTRTLVRELVRARALALALDRALDRALDPGLDLNRALDLDRALDLVRAIDTAIDLASDGLGRHLDRDFAVTRAVNLARTRARDLIRDLKLIRDLDRDFDRALALAREFDHALDPALDPALTHARARARVLDPGLARDFIEARSNLTDAANNFVGADLTTVNPAAVNLTGIRWDRDTQWPTPEWTARIHRASVEDPPGSGVFIVQSEEGHNFVDHGSLAPIS
ncbi:hypothetical protein [Streptomyces sp. NBC_00620]|uniref:hypothetical protein n=1 Tax=Streptomyces sp. NBC_00620 TaxID=2903666 RepID=UPI0022578A29|nr:hypothetical protein [Streptomyces sp. NBC_00620]MCX4974526.1 hypothetical protein [Streptomyces sp. NBC_00620]